MKKIFKKNRKENIYHFGNLDQEELENYYLDDEGYHLEDIKPYCNKKNRREDEE